MVWNGAEAVRYVYVYVCMLVYTHTHILYIIYNIYLIYGYEAKNI